MEDEILAIFDEHYNRIGTSPRKEVHKSGYWHETFHCWLVGREKQKNYLYFQLRSKTKKDFPDLLDITAAGHLLHNENISDGIREIREELGISVCFDDLHGLGVFPYSIRHEDIIDREYANVFLYEHSFTHKDFLLQGEEVSGLYKIELESFAELISGCKTKILAEEFVSASADRVPSNIISASLKHFVPHEPAYYEMVIAEVRKKWLQD
ncbi:NUDIX hydrolase [Mesobacillus foraminis]|uniref:NUDIX hydrolase n=1 Tax=Mesobacillus foraminis TaxID=279826 RepID=UPI000EF46B89|nr:NUDIX domain-containing protein [Mesobacillus foraminis]